MEKNDRNYTNGEITVFWRPAKCTHVTTCFNELIEVFDPSRRPWVNMQGASTREIIRVVDMCPTKALTYKWNKDMKNENEEMRDEPIEINKEVSTEEVTEIKVMKDGPLVVKGNFIIKGKDGQELKKMRMTSFCRCGQSQNMPFCDGMHRKIGFSD
ncbi:MAG: (4Fe-4S)-binding protein [Bacteroidales bacterium]|nr:(4Fe-4S)-binding protein [Bacteroidales bacterium]